MTPPAFRIQLLNLWAETVILDCWTASEGVTFWDPSKFHMFREVLRDALCFTDAFEAYPGLR
jgi:hypothetical protein